MRKEQDLCKGGKMLPGILLSRGKVLYYCRVATKRYIFTGLSDIQSPMMKDTYSSAFATSRVIDPFFASRTLQLYPARRSLEMETWTLAMD